MPPLQLFTGLFVPNPVGSTLANGFAGRAPALPILFKDRPTPIGHFSFGKESSAVNFEPEF